MKFVDEFQIQFAIFNSDSHLFWNGNTWSILVSLTHLPRSKRAFRLPTISVSVLVGFKSITIKRQLVFQNKVHPLKGDCHGMEHDLIKIHKNWKLQVKENTDPFYCSRYSSWSWLLTMIKKTKISGSAFCLHPPRIWRFSSLITIGYLLSFRVI